MEQNTSNGNRNNFYWKNKLEDLSNLPDAVLPDKNVTWEKLHSRLHQKTGRIKIVWYWVAAACLLFAIIIPVMTTNKNQDLTVKNNPKKLPLKKEIFPAKVSSKETTVVDATARANKKKTIQPSVMVDKKTFAAKDTEMMEEPVRLALNDQADIIREPVNSPPVAADSDRLKTLALNPVKKKLKVVHVNELGDAFAETPNIALQNEHHFFQLKLINQQGYSGTTLPSGNTGFTIFKTTKASSN